MTSALWRGVSVIARRKILSGSGLAGRIWWRLTSSLRTTAISNWAKEAPRQRRTPPPTGVCDPSEGQRTLGQALTGDAVVIGVETVRIAVRVMVLEEPLRLRVGAEVGTVAIDKSTSRPRGCHEGEKGESDQ